MKLGELIEKTSWNDVESAFRITYPGKRPYIDQYNKVFLKLKTIKPRQSSISIIIRNVIDDFDNEEYVSVYGLDKKGEVKSEDDLNEALALEFTDWAKWLGMEIDEESYRTFSRQEIICHCLHEMTFDGFSQKKIRQKWQEIVKVADEFNRMSDEEKKKNTITLEELEKRFDI